jgi:hypothetical protein
MRRERLEATSDGIPHHGERFGAGLALAEAPGQSRHPDDVAALCCRDEIDRIRVAAGHAVLAGARRGLPGRLGLAFESL